MRDIGDFFFFREPWMRLWLDDEFAGEFLLGVTFFYLDETVFFSSLVCKMIFSCP